uniref:Uncharacterized protein n=1 Tax=Trichuris muris TaxID=70415 RepID=A0A5S6Q6Q5_TRIMR
MVELFRNAFNYLTSSNEKQDNEFLGRVIVLGSKRLLVRRLLAEVISRWPCALWRRERLATHICAPYGHEKRGRRRPPRERGCVREDLPGSVGAWAVTHGNRTPREVRRAIWSSWELYRGTMDASEAGGSIDLKLIPQFDGSSGQYIVEWLQNVELICAVTAQQGEYNDQSVAMRPLKEGAPSDPHLCP